MTIETAEQAIKAMGAQYGKSIPQLKMLAMRHWKEWLPEMFQKLTKEGMLMYEAMKAAQKAHKEIRQLMDQGYQNHEAEEVVLRKYIILKPEQAVIEEMERE